MSLADAFEIKSPIQKRRIFKMTLVYEGDLPVTFSQLYVWAGGKSGMPAEDHFVGQTNGLCGASVPGILLLVTGLHTGEVRVLVRVASSAPPLDDHWQDVVEVCFRPLDSCCRLTGLDEVDPVDFILPGLNYRVRWAGKGMDAGHAKDHTLDAEPSPDSYELTFWPENEERGDEIVRQTSANASYWNEAWKNAPHSV